MLEAWKIIRDNAIADPINNAVLPVIGLAILIALWYFGSLPFDVIEEIVCHDDLC